MRMRELEALAQRIGEHATPLATDADLDPLIDRIGDARFVLLGEASHGTSEYYTWRARLSRRLITEKGFSFVAVEGDWPDCYRINRYVKGYPDSGSDAREVLNAFERWPTWMWANREVEAFAEWLRQHNASTTSGNGMSGNGTSGRSVGFYGLDVYSLWESMEAIIEHLTENHADDPDLILAARNAWLCFEPYRHDLQDYALQASLLPESCADEVVELLTTLRTHAPRFADDPEGAFDAEQNALVMVNAERYYRSMMAGRAESWNVRDRHMVETLNRLFERHALEAKAIVWEHNTHIGDARATDMARSGMVNVGQLVREQYGGQGVVAVGFGSHRGSVIAGSEWGARMQRMEVPAAIEGSWEDVLHIAGRGEDVLVMLDGVRHERSLAKPIGHRAIGVVYHPHLERYGNYVPSLMPLRYDAFIHIDASHALHPLHLESEHPVDLPETWPWGV